MSGHSKWATTKHQKAVVDARRAKSFAKLIKNIEVAARLGGGDLDGNPTLYDAVQKARKTSVPKDNIDRAIKKASGADSENYDEVRYEGYAPGGVAVIIEALTDNRNRTASDIRAAFSKHGGTLGETNSVAFLFSRLGVIGYPAAVASADQMLDAAIEAGAGGQRLLDHDRAEPSLPLEMASGGGEQTAPPRRPAPSRPRGSG